MHICVRGQLTVFFDCPFWVGVFEVFEGNTLQTCRVVFGSTEPKDYEIYQYVSDHYLRLNFGSLVDIDPDFRPKAINPKRLQRQIRNQLEAVGVSNKSFSAIQAGYEAKKKQLKQNARQRKETRSEIRFQQRQLKKNERHKGH